MEAQRGGADLLRGLVGALGDFQDSLAVWDDVIDIGPGYVDALMPPETPPRTPPRRHERSESVASRRESKRQRRRAADDGSDASGEDLPVRPSTAGRYIRSRSPLAARPTTAPWPGERGLAPGPGAYEPNFEAVARKVYAGTFSRAARAKEPKRKDEETGGDPAQREAQRRPSGGGGGKDADVTIVRADAFVRRRQPAATFAPLPTPSFAPVEGAEGAQPPASDRLPMRLEECQRKLGPGAYEPSYDPVKPRPPAAIIALPTQPPQPRPHRYAPTSDDSDFEFIDLVAMEAEEEARDRRTPGPGHYDPRDSVTRPRAQGPAFGPHVTEREEVDARGRARAAFLRFLRRRTRRGMPGPGDYEPLEDAVHPRIPAASFAGGWATDGADSDGGPGGARDRRRLSAARRRLADEGAMTALSIDLAASTAAVRARAPAPDFGRAPGREAGERRGRAPGELVYSVQYGLTEPRVAGGAIPRHEDGTRSAVPRHRSASPPGLASVRASVPAAGAERRSERRTPSPAPLQQWAEGDRLLLDTAAADAALRPRHPSLRLSPAPAPRPRVWEPPRLFYDVNLDAVRPSVAVSVPDLSRSAARFAAPKEEDAELGPGAYDSAAAFAALEPEAAAAPFGRSASIRFDYPVDGSLPPKPPARDGDRVPIRPSLALVRPSIPSAIIAPEPSSAPPPSPPERYHDAPYEPNVDATRRRADAAAPDFARMLPRRDEGPAEDARPPLDVRTGLTEPAAPAFSVPRAAAGERLEAGGAAEEGDALDLDPRRPEAGHGAALEMARQAGRPDPTPPPDRRPVYRAEDADGLVRPRVPVALIPAPPDAAEEARRERERAASQPPGPGTYRPEPAVVLPAAPAADFARGPERFAGPKEGTAEGDVLDLEAAAAADATRPPAPAFTIPPEHAPPQPQPPERYRDAPYEPRLEAVRPLPAGAVSFERQTDRDDGPAQADSGVEWLRYRPSHRLVEPAVRLVPDLARQSATGRLEPLAAAGEGDTLELEPGRGEALVGPRRSAGALEFDKQTGRPGLPAAPAAAPDADYDPREELVRPRAPVALIPDAPDAAEVARRERERALQQPPGPGRYQPDAAAVLPAAPSMVDYSAGAPTGRAPEDPRRAGPREGDVLVLEPRDGATRASPPAPVDIARQLPRPASGLARPPAYEDSALDVRDEALRPAVPGPSLARHRPRPQQLFEILSEAPDALLYHPERGYAAVEPEPEAHDFGSRASRAGLEKAEGRARADLPDALRYTPRLSQTLPAVKGAPEFGRQAGRPVGGGPEIEEGQELKYEPDLGAVRPRTDLSVPDLARLSGRPRPGPPPEEGSELKYDPDRPRHVPGPSLSLQSGRPADGGPLGGRKGEEGSELKYEPNVEAVLPRPPGAPEFGRALGRDDTPAPEAAEGQELKYEPRLSLVKPRTDASVPDVARSTGRGDGAGPLRPRTPEEGSELKYAVRWEAVEPRASRGGALPLDKQMGRADLPQPEPMEGSELKYDPEPRRSIKGFVDVERQLPRPDPGPDPDKVLEGSEFKYEARVPPRDGAVGDIDFSRQSARKEREIAHERTGETMLAHGQDRLTTVGSEMTPGPEFGLLIPREGSSDTARMVSGYMRWRGDERRAAAAAARAEGADHYVSIMRLDEANAGPVAGREADLAHAAAAAEAAVKAAWSRKPKKRGEGPAAGAAPAATWQLRGRPSGEAEDGSPRSSGEGARWLSGNPATGEGVPVEGRRTLRVVLPAAPQPLRPLALARASAAAERGLPDIPEEP